MRVLAARASRRWWVLWRPFWKCWPLVLSARIQLAVVVLALVPALVRLDPGTGTVVSAAPTFLIVYGAYAQVRRRFRLRRFVPWNQREES